MTTSDPALIASALPSARRYYVWQIAMWLIILHTTLFGMFMAVMIGRVEYFPKFDFGGVWNIHVQLARSLTSPPVLPMLAGFMLVPIAVVACYRASVGKRAMGWLLGYWLSVVTICVLLVSAWFVLYYCTGSKSYIRQHPCGGLTDALILCVLCPPPLPVTLLAALLTIERKKRTPTLESGA